MRRKPYSQACENNKDAIAAVLREAFADRHDVLEIGSGTGQHAVHFGRGLPHLIWQTSDVAANHEGILAWLEDAALSNVLPPLDLDVTVEPWPVTEVSAVFSANTAHIMHFHEVEALFAGCGRTLESHGVFALYGPFSYGGRHTSESNTRFDASLRAADPGMGVRDIDALMAVAHNSGLALGDDHAMPANNRLLIWRKA
ncbi:MAG: DUF938 domain-containing protein [Gammaproteobacteria bacterium]